MVVQIGKRLVLVTTLLQYCDAKRLTSHYARSLLAAWTTLVFLVNILVNKASSENRHAILFNSPIKTILLFPKKVTRPFHVVACVIFKS